VADNKIVLWSPDIMKALFIPADSARKVEVIDISGQDDIHALGGGISVPSRYDSDSIMFVIQRTTREMNVRATGHIEVPAAERIWQGTRTCPLTRSTGTL